MFLNSVGSMINIQKSNNTNSGTERAAGIHCIGRLGGLDMLMTLCLGWQVHLLGTDQLSAAIEIFLWCTGIKKPINIHNTRVEVGSIDRYDIKRSHSSEHQRK